MSMCRDEEMHLEEETVARRMAELDEEARQMAEIKIHAPRPPALAELFRRQREIIEQLGKLGFPN